MISRNSNFKPSRARLSATLRRRTCRHRRPYVVAAWRLCPKLTPLGRDALNPSHRSPRRLAHSFFFFSRPLSARRHCRSLQPRALTTAPPLDRPATPAVRRHLLLLSQVAIPSNSLHTDRIEPSLSTPATERRRRIHPLGCSRIQLISHRSSSPRLPPL